MSESVSRYAERIADLAAEARRARESFEAPTAPPDEDRAVACARDGLGDVVALYVEARLEDEPVRFSAEEFDQLHRATNDWLAQYAGCYGVDVDPEATVRRAAELLVETHDVVETATLLTGVPDR